MSGIDAIGKVDLFGADRAEQKNNKKRFDIGEFAGAVLPGLLNGKLDASSFTTNKANESGQSAFGG